jgi:hypothetical protein
VQVGYVKALPAVKGKKYAAALHLCDQQSQGGIEIFCFYLNANRYALIALNESKPVPGHDYIGSKENVWQLGLDFANLQENQPIRYVGNTGIFDMEETLTLEKAFSNPSPNSEFASITNQPLIVGLPNLARTEHDSERKIGNRVRKVMLFWSLLDICGFEVNPQRLQNRMEAIGITQPFNPSFPQLLRMSAYQAIRNSPPPPLPTTFADMVTEISVVARFSQSYQNDPSLRRNGQFIFDSDEEIMISFMFPPTGYSPFVLRPCLQFHSPEAGDFVAEILYKLAQGETVILDLGSANEQIIRYFSRSLSEAVFREQETKFVSNTLNNNFIQIYFEEAHMIFPPNAGNTIDVYSRFAKEGAKFNIGIVYSTQSPSTVNRDLLSQTENFFIGHLSSSIDTDQLASIQHAFHNVGQIIMRQRTRGLLHVLTHSHRYVIPVQANRYNGVSRLASLKA